ncbi:MAG: hypothetical protein WC516_02945 [Patescibacteria group bacterium]
MENSKKSVNWEPINFFTYLSFIKWPLLVALVVELIFRILAVRFVDGLLFQQQELTIWIWRLLILIFITWRTIKTYGQVPQIGALAGGIFGLLVGVVIGLFRFYDGFKVWKIFNIFTEGLLTAVVGAVVIFLIIYIWEFIPRKK